MGSAAAIARVLVAALLGGFVAQRLGQPLVLGLEFNLTRLANLDPDTLLLADDQLAVFGTAAQQAAFVELLSAPTDGAPYAVASLASAPSGD